VRGIKFKYKVLITKELNMSAMLMSLLILTGILNNPPEDLLSLGNTEKIMTTLKIDQSEIALINILGGIKSEKKMDTAKLEAAIKMLREGKTKERREAKKVLNDAGREALPFFEKYVNDSDPEVSQTAKNIIKESKVTTKQDASAGLTADVLKMLAIRRLTELKSKPALFAIKELVNSPDYGVAREAKRAEAILEGRKAERLKRAEASLKALQLIPQNAGSVAVLDTTEPPKSMSLTDYLKQAMKVPIPGMNAEMISGQFNQFLPRLMTMIGNPQIDAIAMAMSDNIGVDENSAWGGFIFIGSYDLKKMKRTLGMQMEIREFGGKKYYALRRGPSICPVDENTLIISMGPGKAEHMAHFIKQLAIKKVPEKFADLKDTSGSRLMAMGELSKEQRKVMKAELQQELQSVQNRQGPETEVQVALINVAILFTDTSKLKAVYDKKVITITGMLPDENKATKMADAVKTADEKLRKLIETAGGGMMAQFIDTKKAFAGGRSEGKKIQLQINSGFLNTGMLSMFFLNNMDAGPAQVQPRIVEEKQAIEKRPAEKAPKK
jgi:hypothetical protein